MLSLTARRPETHRLSCCGQMSSAIGLRRLVSQCIAATARCEEPADVVGRLCAVQAQDYRQSLWAIGARLRSGTADDVERAIEQRSILRTWLVRGTIHFVRPGDVRWLLALAAPRLAAADARSGAPLGLTAAQIDRCAELLSDALAGDRRLTRPEVLRLLAAAGIDTAGQRGYHILVRLARRDSSASGRCRASSRRSSYWTTGRPAQQRVISHTTRRWPCWPRGSRSDGAL